MSDGYLDQDKRFCSECFREVYCSEWNSDLKLCRACSWQLEKEYEGRKK